MNPQEAYQKMRKDLGLDSKSGYKDSGVGNGNDPWRSYESGSATRTSQQRSIDDELNRLGGLNTVGRNAANANVDRITAVKVIHIDTNGNITFE